MRAGGDVDEIVLALRIERIAGREIVQRAIHFLEIPRVLQVDPVKPHIGLGRNAGDVGTQMFGELLGPAVVDQLKPVD